MVSILNRPTGGASDDSSAHRQSAEQAEPAYRSSVVRPAAADTHRPALRIERASPRPNSVVLPSAIANGAARNGAAHSASVAPTSVTTVSARSAGPSTWACLCRQPGTLWRVSPPTGPAMPASWAHHAAAEFVPEAPTPRPVVTPTGALPADFAFGDLRLSESVRRAVWEAGYRQPTPIQTATVPVLLAGKDCVGQAQTGTGKTAAFGLPIVEGVDPRRREVQALVMLPTRELCRQVATELERLGKHRGLQTLAIYGGEGMGRQLDALHAGVHVVVGTPGRVQDHIWRGTLRLDAVRFAVLDEADEMLDVGFAEDIERILRCVPQERQTALFSATVPPFVRTLVRRYMRDPEWISTVDQTQVSRIPTQIRQSYINVAERDKLEALEELTRAEPGYDRVLVFRRMKIHSDRLAEAMRRKGYSVRALHGDLPQSERNRVLEDFKAGRIQFLVATNVAARGLDISDVSHVLNYDVPDTAEEYVHRIGRTGRAGKVGTAISFVAEWDFEAFEAIKAHVGDALTERPLNLYANR